MNNDDVITKGLWNGVVSDTIIYGQSLVKVEWDEKSGKIKTTRVAPGQQYSYKEKTMTIKTLASKIAKLEGKKSEARIGDIREILGILSDVFYEDFNSRTYLALFKNGEKRAKKKPKKKVIK